MFDLLVIGGGINGAGIARDAAMRGLSVCLVEKEDWGCGTSSKSSMLAHGGLRYLEQFELGLVHEALQERERLLAQAPHLVRPLRFLYPLYPDVARRRTVRIGMWLYDLLSRRKSVPKRDFLDRQEALREAPVLEPDGLQGAAAYFDAQIHSVERLVAELVWDARRHGAACHNHTTVIDLGLDEDPSQADGTGLRCTGAMVRRADGRAWRVRAHAVVNAAGPWVDDVLGPLNAGRAPMIRKTKGAHVVLPRFLDVALIVRSARDGRTFFILPWKRHSLLGTTDTDYMGDPGTAAATTEDVQYLIESARRYVPDAPFDQIQYTYAGVRPLVNQEGLTESNVTRRHVIHDHAGDGVRGLWSVQGGKITTYRSVAEDAVAQVCRALGRDQEARDHPTRTGTLPGGPLVAWDTFREEAVAAAVKDFGIPMPSAEHLVDTYGSRWRHVLAESDDDDADRRRITKGLPHLWAEVLYAVREEDAATLRDVMLRRTDLGLSDDGRPDVADKVARRMGDWLDWSRSRRRQELAEYEAAVQVFAVPSGPDGNLAGPDRETGDPQGRAAGPPAPEP